MAVRVDSGLEFENRFDVKVLELKRESSPVFLESVNMASPIID